MRKFITIIPLILLTGCMTARFDNQELKIATEMRYLTQEKSLCNDFDTARHSAIVLEQKALFFKLYVEHIPNNKDTVGMVHELHAQAADFNKAYKERHPSAAYCRNKLEVMNKSAETVQKAMARKLRK